VNDPEQFLEVIWCTEAGKRCAKVLQPSAKCIDVLTVIVDVLSSSSAAVSWLSTG
jgi:hypothetical protein